MLALGLSSAVTAACGSSSISGSTGGGGATTTTLATGGSGTGGADCAVLTANATTTPVTVRFVNNTAADIYVPFPTVQSCVRTNFTITDPGNDMLGYQTDTCNTTCEAAACTCVVTNTCSMYPPVTRVAPHGAASLQWSGGVLENRTVPTACMSGSSCSGSQTMASCQAFIKPKAFPLSFTAEAWTSVTCPGTGSCTCTPDASGSCALPSGSPGGTALHGAGSFAEGAASVDIAFN